MDTWDTSDLALAAWVACHAGEPTAIPKSKWCLFSFQNPEACREIALEYFASEACKFDAVVRAIRKVLAGFYWSRGAQLSSQWSTRNLSLAAYAIVRGTHLSGVAREENDGRRPFYVYHFSNGDLEKMRVDWESSEAKLFDNQVRRLKRMS